MPKAVSLLPWMISSIFVFFLLMAERGFAKEMTLEERRSENNRIQEAIRLTQQSGKQPSSSESPRANRVAMNRYRNQSAPFYPKLLNGNYRSLRKSL